MKQGGDFYGSELSYIMPAKGSVTVTLHTKDGKEVVLK